jgi:hypothetical protein
MKSSIHQVKYSVKSVTSTPGQAEERVSELEDKVDELSHSDSNKEIK